MALNVLILLVEDETLIQDLLQEALTEAGFALVITGTAEGALVELDADASRFRALITDIRLGDGPDGWDVARHARERVPEMPVVYMSGDSGADWAAKGVPGSIWCTSPS